MHFYLFCKVEVAKLGIVIVAVMRATKRSRVFFIVVNILGLNNKKSENFTFSLLIGIWRDLGYTNK